MNGGYTIIKKSELLKGWQYDTEGEEITRVFIKPSSQNVWGKILSMANSQKPIFIYDDFVNAFFITDSLTGETAELELPTLIKNPLLLTYTGYTGDSIEELQIFSDAPIYYDSEEELIIYEGAI